MKTLLLLFVRSLAFSLIPLSVLAAPDTASLDEFVLKTMATENIPGISVAVIDHNGPGKSSLAANSI